MQSSADALEDIPDPRLAAFAQIRALPVPAITFAPQATVEDGLPGFQSGNDQHGPREMSVSFSYILIRNPDDRFAPENLRELDEDTRRAFEMLPSLDRPSWIVEMSERARFPELFEAVRTSWFRTDDERSTLDAVLIEHVNHVLRNQYRAERGWEGSVGSMSPAPDVTATAIQQDARVVVDGETLEGIRVDTDPHIYALGARLPSAGILTVVVPRDELDHLTLAFQTFAADEPPAVPVRSAPAATRSPRAMPHNPWPRDMAITVDDDSGMLLELLWIREAWQLKPIGDDLPPLLVDTPAAIGDSDRSRAPIAEWEDAWPQIWRDCLRHAGSARDAGAFDRMRSTPAGAERAALIKAMVGPSWEDSFGLDALTDQYERWQQMLGEQRHSQMMQPIGEQPERVVLDALIPAWRSGLTTIVQIPCRGTYMKVIGPHALLLTAETRAAADSYRSALASFR